MRKREEDGKKQKEGKKEAGTEGKGRRVRKRKGMEGQEERDTR